jgi:lysylphosphatidylglycerol synthetase-like protein (DUF2156 family)
MLRIIFFNIYNLLRRFNFFLKVLLNKIGSLLILFIIILFIRNLALVKYFYLLLIIFFLFFNLLYNLLCLLLRESFMSFLSVYSMYNLLVLVLEILFSLYRRIYLQYRILIMLTGIFICWGKYLRFFLYNAALDFCRILKFLFRSDLLFNYRYTIHFWL